MVLISQYSTQGSSAIPKLWSKEVKLRPFVTLQMVGRLNMTSAPFKGHSFTSTRSPVIHHRDVKCLQVFAWEGSFQNDESKPKTSGSVEEEMIARSPDIDVLFKKFLMMFQTQAPNRSTRGVAEEAPPQGSDSKTQNQIWRQQHEAAKIIVKALAQNDESGSKTSGCVKESQLSFSSDEETIARSGNIDELFKKILMMLQTHAPNQSTRGIADAAPPYDNVSEAQNQLGSQKQKKAMSLYLVKIIELVLLLAIYVMLRYCLTNPPPLSP